MKKLVNINQRAEARNHLSSKYGYSEIKKIEITQAGA